MVQFLAALGSAASDAAGLIGRHPYWSLAGVLAIVLILRAELARARRALLLPVIAAFRRSSRVSWRKAKHQGALSRHRWNEITLYSSWGDATSRLVFGLLGAAIVVLSLELSYRGLLPNVFEAAHNAAQPENRVESMLLQELSDQHTQLIILFEAALGFICLELFGVTDVFRFPERYPSRGLQFFAGGFIFAVLLGFGVLEAWLGLAANELRFDSECMAIKMVNRVCEKGAGPYSLFFPPHRMNAADRQDAVPPIQARLQRLLRNKTHSVTVAPPAAPDSMGDPRLKGKQELEGKKRAIEILYVKAWFDFCFSIIMPLALMVVGLAVDFFEEMYLPAASLGFCLFHTGSALVLLTVFLLALAILWLLDIAGTLLTFPADVAGAALGKIYR